MKTNYLFPHKCKWIGWALFVPFFLLAIYSLVADQEIDNWVTLPWPCIGWAFFSNAAGDIGINSVGLGDEIEGVVLTVSLLLIGFAREKQEDEYTIALRFKSLAWSMKVDAALLIAALLFTYGMVFFYFWYAYLILIFLLYVGRFYYELYKFRRSSDEE